MKKLFLLVVMVTTFFEFTSAQWTVVGIAFPGFVRGLFFVNENVGYAAGGDGVTLGYISKTTDGGVTWTYTSTTESNLLRAVDFLDDETGYVCGAAGVLMKTTDGGATWNTIYTNSSQYFRSIDFISSQVGFMAGALGTIWKTTDGGTTWSMYSLSQNMSDVIQLHMVDANTGYAVCSAGVAPFANGYVFKTTDGGDSWTQVYFDATTGFLGLAVVDANTAYAGGLNQTIIKTTDGGVSWTNSYTGLAGVSIRTGSAVSDQMIFMADDGSNVLSTGNAGSTWNDTILANGLYAMYFPNSSIGFTGDGLGNVYKIELCRPPSGLSAIAASPNSAKLEWDAVGEAIGYNIFYRPVNTTQGITKRTTSNHKLIKNLLPGTTYQWGVQTICDNHPLIVSTYTPGQNFTTPPLRLSDEENTITALDVFPNPASGLITISFSLNKTSPVLIRLTDVSGRVVREIINGAYSPGSYQIPFNSSEVSEGIYMVQVLSNESNSTVKLLVSR